MSDHSWLDFAASYALDTLSPEERTAFEAHLADCPRCQAEVRAHREVGGLLALAVPAQSPPPGLKGRVLREAARRPAARRMGSRMSGGWLAAAALLLVAIGLGVFGWTAREGRRAAERQLARTRSDLAARDSLLGALLAPDLAWARLTTTDAAPSIRLFWSRSQGLVVLAAFRLPAAPVGRTYQLWGIAEGGAPVSVGTFNTSVDGQATATFHVDPGAEFAVSAVTEEPRGGSVQPTSAPFLVGSWQAGP